MATARVEHEITVSAHARDVYDLLANAVEWPRVFPPTVHVEQLERGEGTERLRIWATAHGDVRDWTSRRTLDADALTITFRQEVSPAPVEFMSGGWIVEPLSADECRVRLLHEFRAIDDDPDDLARISAAVDANSRSELASLKSTAEFAVSARDLTFSFADSLHVNGSADQAREFIRDAARWPDRLPHVASVDLTELPDGVQTLEMRTRSHDGSTHTTRSHRVCLPDKIAYKQVTLPASLVAHTGCWTFEPDGDGVLVTSHHSVVISRNAITEVLGPDGDAASARKLVRDALGGNSRATLQHAKQHVEQQAEAA
ncbi:aromatase/cyclase [Lentzea sp. NBRC 102530]|uniref:aromatase/cyclase n=1 Tax=Lentzea sp. NBRC 102530 TaxID=3032201 RepID=UPI002555F604|nr:aromatase/cyclase [Lentzea sp. NBRC 102530]